MKIRQEPELDTDLIQVQKQQSAMLQLAIAGMPFGPWAMGNYTTAKDNYKTVDMASISLLEV
jgi:hypothetical protein